MEALGIACLRPRLFVKKYIDLTSLPLNPERTNVSNSLFSNVFGRTIYFDGLTKCMTAPLAVNSVKLRVKLRCHR